MYTSKDVARITGESEHTIRYYCKKGLLPFATRDRNNVRRFSEDDIEGATIVLCLRDTGMPLSEIRHYMDLCTEGVSTLPQRLEIIQKQKERAYEELRGYQAKVAHLEDKERFYLHALKTGVEEDECNPVKR